MKLLLRSCLLGWMGLLAAQSHAQPTPFCGTPAPPKERLEAYQRWVKTHRTARTALGSTAFVPVIFTFVRPASQAGQPLTTLQLDNAFRNLFWLEKYYRAGNLSYFIAGLNTLDNDADNNRVWYQETDPILPQRLPKNALNVVVVPKIAFGVAGYAYYPAAGQFSNVVVVGSDYYGYQENLAPHEIGHYFNLIHTHEQGNELVDGSNCTTAGDLVCDTPADPYGKPNAASSGCNYTGTATDANGQTYNPDLKNLMGYWHTQGCTTDHFTPGQLERAYLGYQFRKSNPGFGTDYYDFSAPPKDIVPANLRITGRAPGTNQIDVGAEWNTPTTHHSQILLERAASRDGPWAPIAFFYVSPATQGGYGDRVPNPDVAWYYRARHLTSSQYSNVAAYLPRNAQTITFNPIPNQAYGNEPVDLLASSSSGLPVTFQVSGPVRFSEGHLSFIGVGDVTVTASQPGNENYLPAPDVTRRFTIGKGTQVITFEPIPTKTYGDAPFLLPARLNSALLLTFAIAGPVVFDGTTLKITGTGPVRITASQPGNENYLAAQPVTQEFLVEKAPQTLLFPGPALAFGTGTATLSPTSREGFPVQYAVVSGPASLTDSVLIFSDYGQVTLRASQPGNENYRVMDLTRPFCVNPDRPVVTFAPASDVTLLSSSPFRNQWFRNGDTLRGATAPRLTITRSGDYTVRTSNPVAACNASQVSEVKTVAITALNAPPAEWKLELSPNPASDFLTVRLTAPGLTGVPVIEVLDELGRVLLARKMGLLTGRYEALVPVRGLTAGLYLVRVAAGGRVAVGRVVVE